MAWGVPILHNECCNTKTYRWFGWFALPFYSLKEKQESMSVKCLSNLVKCMVSAFKTEEKGEVVVANTDVKLHRTVHNVISQQHSLIKMLPF